MHVYLLQDMYGEELEDHDPNGIIDYLKSKVPHEGISDVSISPHP